MPFSETWKTKIINANKYYQQWENRFDCKTLEDYWEGFQWRQVTDIKYYRPYIVNLFYSEIQKKLANILKQNLTFEITPECGNYGANPEFAFDIAQNKQDFVNEMLRRANVDNRFNEQIKLTAMDSFFRFGVMEIGYAADWRNPAKKPPVTTAHDDNSIPEDDAKIIEDEEVPENERAFFKRIKASRFRVSTSDDPAIENCSWCGYYSYIYKSFLRKLKGVDVSDITDKDYSGISTDWIGLKMNMNTSSASADNRDMIKAYQDGKVDKVWHIFDNETQKRLLIQEPNFNIIWESDIYRLPFATHRHAFRLDGWYPIPPLWHWLAPQNDINEAREQMRNYRRRFTRKFSFWGYDQEEIEKFKSEVDGEVIKAKNPNSTIAAINNPEIGISITDGLNASRDDFNTVSGSSSDLSTAQSDRTTATQSKITAMKAQVIESIEQIEFDIFYQKVGRRALIVGQENFSNGLWVKNTSGPGELFLQQLDPAKALSIRFITSSMLNDDFDFTISINCVNADPATMQAELDKFVKFLTIVNSFPQIQLSADLIVEAAYRVGYRNKKVIAEMQRAALLSMMGQAAQGIQNLGGQQSQQLGGPNANNGAAGNMLRNAAPASQDIIDSQLMNQ